MTIDIAPVIPEFGQGACTCNGEMTGCAVCSTGSVLLRFGKTIPRLADGHPDMRTLGYRMGKHHRDEDPRVRHGLSLSGSCSPPNSGTNWCAFCAYLQLAASGLPAHYANLATPAILANLKAGHPMIVPGLYSKVPVVSLTSYSGSVPAKGRSDSGFGGTHMVAVFGVTFAGTTPISVILADPDFGSPSRPVVPPHSEWPWQTFLNFRNALGWGIAYVDAKPPSPTAPVPLPPSPTQYQVTVRPASGTYYSYDIAKTAAHPEGQVIRRVKRQTGGFQASCTGARTYRFPAEHSNVEVVRITSGDYRGRWISSKWSDER